MSTARRFICKSLMRAGNSLTAIGCVGLMLSLRDAIPAEFFAIGIA